MKKQYYYLIAIAIIVIDQFTKYLVSTYMEVGESFTLIPGVLDITSHRNSGAAWGVMEGRMLFFYVMTIACCVFMIYYIQKYSEVSMLFGISMALMLGGSIGNFIDRVRFEYVVDFFQFTFIDFPIFNVADIALTFGTGLVIIFILFDKKSKEVFDLE